MSRTSPFSLASLRSSRGLWLVCVLALLFKLGTGALCDVDGLQGGTAKTVAVHAAVSDSAGNDGCVLGEGAGCHCSCAHAAPLIPDAWFGNAIALPAVAVVPAPAPAVRSAPLATPHRPPIA